MVTGVQTCALPIFSFFGAGRINIESGLAGALFTRDLVNGFAGIDLARASDDDGVLPRGYLSGIDGILLMRGQPLAGLEPVPESEAGGPV